VAVGKLFGEQLTWRQTHASYEEVRAANDAPRAQQEREYMKFVRMFLLVLLVAVASGIAPSIGNAQSSAGVPNPAAEPPAVQILSPLAGQMLNENFVDIRFELVRPALSDEPNFLVQLDSNDPINTSDTDYTFSDLQPGLHTVRVTLVDANNVPVQGGTAIVRFKVPSSSQPAQNDGSPHSPQHFTRFLSGAAPAAPIPPELRNDGDTILPLAGSPLPLISIVGFGLLLGGAVRAMRGR